MVEDSLDCPLVELGLIRTSSDARSFQFRRGPQEDLPDGILFFATLQFWQAFAPSSQTLSISDLRGNQAALAGCSRSTNRR